MTRPFTVEIQEVGRCTRGRLPPLPHLDGLALVRVFLPLALDESISRACDQRPITGELQCHLVRLDLLHHGDNLIGLSDNLNPLLEAELEDTSIVHRCPRIIVLPKGPGMFARLYAI